MMTGTRAATLVLLLLLVMASFAAMSYAAAPAAGSDDDSPAPAAAEPSITFGAVGDWSSDKPGYPISQAMMKRLVARGGTFVLGLGDLGYQPGDEANWCSKIKAVVDQTIVVAGNHDDGTNTGGNINNYVQYCPFNMDADLVAGPTYGYGKSYYLDYPRTTPLVRILMVTAGLTGAPVSGQNYNPGGAEYTWTMNAISAAKAAGIPWIVVGVHKLCLNAGSYGCEIGQAFWDALIDAGVDLVLTGHYHVYERSYQVAHSASCASVKDGSYNAACVADFDNTMVKDAGLVQVTDGAGGTSLYSYDGTNDGQYFPAYMMSNANSQGKNTGWGPLIVRLNATTLVGSTAFCPGGTTDATGECTSAASGTFQDSFTITSSAAPPPALGASFTYSPTSPVAGQTVTFSGSASGGQSPYSYAWTFGDGATGTGATATHAYAGAGSYNAELTVTDAGSHSAKASETVSVTAPPSGNPTASFSFTPNWPKTSEAVTFDASASSSPNPGDTLEVRWDWTDDGTFDTGWSTTFVTTHTYASAGTFNARLQVRNGVGLMDNRTHAVPVDGAPPATTASLQGTAGQHGWYRSGVTASFSSTDEVSGVAATWYRIDNGSWGQGTSASLLGDRVHTLDYYSTDRSGRTESTHTLLVPIDQTNPATTEVLDGTQDPNGSYVVSANVTLTSADALSGLDATRYRVDGSAWGIYTSRFLVTGSGGHRVEFYATDLAGNTESTKSVAFTIANASGVPTGPPVTTLSLSGTLGAAGWYVSSVDVVLAASSPGGLGVTIHYRIDNGSWVSYSTPFAIAEGRHTLDYYATDAAATQETIRTTNIRVDAQTPVTSASLLGTKGRDHWFRGPVTVTLSASDGTSGVASTAYRLDGGGWQAYASPFTVGEGRHTLEYGSTDRAGNAEPVVSAGIKVDSSPPRMNLAPTPSILTVSSLTLQWTETDAVAGVVENQVSTDGAAFVSLGLNTSTTLTLPDGDHTITVRAFDDAGNAAWANVTVRVDTNVFSPTGPLQGMPTYIVITIVVGSLLLLILVRRGRARRLRRQRALARMRVRSR